MNLSKSMFDALSKMDRIYGCESIPFRTGEALRKRGLADRHTIFGLKAEYVTHDSSTTQWEASAKAPHLICDWYITKAGREVLAATRI